MHKRSDRIEHLKTGKLLRKWGYPQTIRRRIGENDVVYTKAKSSDPVCPTERELARELKKFVNNESDLFDLILLLGDAEELADTYIRLAKQRKSKLRVQARKSSK